LRTAALVSIFAGLAAIAACGAPLHAQQSAGLGGHSSFGISTSYSPSSSHILIGDAEERRILTLGLEYTRLLSRGQHLRLDYEGSVMPLYEETDPFAEGTYFSLAGQSIVTQQPPTRIVYAIRGPVGTIAAGNGTTVPVFALTGRQDTYAAAFTPLGARISALPRRRIQPSFSIDLGFVLAARDLPIDNSDWFNYLFSFGPGVQLFTDAHTSWRLEYLYRHTSNAGRGAQNPGVDQGVVRVTLSLHR
jgi:hypothetical protein